MFGSFIKKNEDPLIMYAYTELFFEQNVQFEIDGSIDIVKLNDRLLSKNRNLLEIELMYQYNLPENMKDLSKTEYLSKTIRNIKIKKKNAVWQELINNRILVVNCGRYLKFAVIDLKEIQKNSKQFVETQEE